MRDELSELLHDAIDAVLDDDLTRDEYISLSRQLIDLATPFPEPIESIADAVLDPLILKVERILIKAFRKHPEKILARAQKADEKGRAKAADRLRRVADRVIKRQSE